MAIQLANTVRASTLAARATNEHADVEVEKADAEAHGGYPRTGLHNNLN